MSNGLGCLIGVTSNNTGHSAPCAPADVQVRLTICSVKNGTNNGVFWEINNCILQHYRSLIQSKCRETHLLWLTYFLFDQLLKLHIVLSYKTHAAGCYVSGEARAKIITPSRWFLPLF